VIEILSHCGLKLTKKWAASIMLLSESIPIKKEIGTMKLKAISATVMGLALGTAIAAPATGAKPSPAFANEQIIFGNSVLPQMQSKLSQNIYFGGLANADFLYTTDVNYDGTKSVFTPAKTESSRFQISNANVFVGGNYGWAHGVLNLGYVAKSTWNHTAGFNSGFARATDNVGLDEAYVNLYSDTAGNSEPYMRMGKFYSAYGKYNPYTQFPSLTDLLEGMNATGAELGYILKTNGMTFVVNGSAVSGAITGQKTVGVGVGTKDTVDNFTANAAMSGGFGSVKYTLGGGWLDNSKDLMFDATNQTGADAYNVYLGLTMNALSMNVKYAALGKSGTNKALGALTVDGAYAFKLMNMDSSLGMNFGMSHDATGISLPEYQIGASYDLHVSQYLTAGATYMHSMDYANKGTTPGTGDNNNIFGVRMGVNF
jgi:hypothetical protein